MAPMPDDTPALGQICLQLHPDLAPGLDLAALEARCEAVARATPGVRGFGMSEGEDDGAFVNFVFAAEDPAAAWPRLSEALFDEAYGGATLRDACLCLCTGDDGWNDARLLHHYDPEVGGDDDAGADA
jgi:hypothetical protein